MDEILQEILKIIEIADTLQISKERIGHIFNEYVSIRKLRQGCHVSFQTNENLTSKCIRIHPIFRILPSVTF